MEFRKTSLGIILRDLGSTLLLLPISFIVPIVIAIIYKEFDLIIIFLIPAIIVFIVGYAFKRFFYSEEPARLRHAMAVSALLYFFAMLFGAIPLAFWQMSYIDACFEAMSGWSTTGLTMILKLELAPRSILFYRSFIQWVGGAGIIVLMLTILSRPGLTTFALYRAEAREERIRPSIFGTARTIWWIYLIFTGLGILLFWTAGMPIFDSINHAMVGIATGGFSTRSNSIGAYNNQLIELVAMMVMGLGAINFGVHYRAITKSPREYVDDPEIMGLLTIILGSTFLVFFDVLKIFNNISESFRHSLFQVVSCLTTTGFQSTGLENLGDFSKVVMGTLMVIGASTGSTCGGIKLMRVIVLAIVTRWQVTRILLPIGAVKPARLGNLLISDEMVRDASIFIFVFTAFAGLTAFIFMALGHSFANSFFVVGTALGNSGLSIGVVTPSLDIIGKIVLIFDMWIGRLEIIPVLILLTAFFWAKR